MFIMTQDNKNLLNSFYLMGFQIQGVAETKESQILGVTTAGQGLILGKYPTEDRSKEILMDILVNIDSLRYEMPLY